MNWLAVKDVSPPEDVEIVVYATAYGHTYVTTVRLESLVAYGQIRQTWVNPVGFGGRDCESDFEYKDITHWTMPPSPPPLVKAQQCDHGPATGRHHGYDHVECECGAFMTDSGWGIASNRWFKNRDEAEFYKKHGRLPE